MATYDLGSIASGAAAGAAFGPIGMAVGAVVGGVFGGKAKRNQRKAARVAREINAINRYQARKSAIIEGVAMQAQAAVAGYSAGVNPEGTSSAISMAQSAYSSTQSALKTEAQIFGRQQKIEKYTKTAARATNTFEAIKGFASAAGTIYGALPATSEGSVRKTAAYLDLAKRSGVSNPTFP